MANGDSYPPLRMGYKPEFEMQPGEQITATIKHVFHGTSQFSKQDPEKPYVGLVLDIQQARNNALVNQKRCFFLKGTYRNDFLGGQWGINDLINIGYGGQKEPGQKTSKHLLYIQGQRSNNSRFVPVPDDIKNSDESGSFTPAAPPQLAAMPQQSSYPESRTNLPAGPHGQVGFPVQTHPQAASTQYPPQPQPNNPNQPVQPQNPNSGFPTFN